MQESSLRPKARIDGRKMAETLLDMITCQGEIVPWADGTGADYADSLLRKLKELLPQKAKRSEPARPIPLARLGSERILFGKFEGEKYEDTPLSYLEWMQAHNEDVDKTLRAYLTHKDNQRTE